MANLHDVAKRARVAPITVSRVINNSGYVAREVRDRVEAAVAELGYVPNGLARGLRSKRTHTLALVLTDITNPFFTTVARGVEDEAGEAGFMVIVCNTDESEPKERTYLRLLLQNRVEGVLLVPARSPEESVRLLQQHGTAVVVLDRRVEDTPVDVVRCDSEPAAYELTRLLVSLGHRRIALLTGPQEVSTSADRAAGFLRALDDVLGQGVGSVCYGAFTRDSGYAMTCEALAADPRPTAFLAANNFIALGALRALRASRLLVPEDAALVGFDDLPPAVVPFPFLTVAAQPAYEMGQRATRLLLDRVRGDPLRPFEEVILPMEIIVRQSSGGVVH